MRIKSTPLSLVAPDLGSVVKLIEAFVIRFRKLRFLLFFCSV